jgi:hypothetical protein
MKCSRPAPSCSEGWPPFLCQLLLLTSGCALLYITATVWWGMPHKGLTSKAQSPEWCCCHWGKPWKRPVRPKSSPIFLLLPSHEVNGFATQLPCCAALSHAQKQMEPIKHGFSPSLSLSLSLSLLPSFPPSPLCLCSVLGLTLRVLYLLGKQEL